MTQRYKKMAKAVKARGNSMDIFYRQYDYRVNDVSDAASDEYMIVSDNEVFSVNKSAYELWKNSRLFSSIDANDGLQVLKKRFRIENESNVIDEVKQCLKQMCDCHLLIQLDQDESWKFEEYYNHFRREFEIKGYSTEPCCEWFGEYRKSYPKRLLVRTDMKVDLSWFEDICDVDDESMHKIAVFFPGGKNLHLVNTEYLNATRGEDASEGIEKYCIGKPLLPSRLAETVPKQNERFSLRQEEDGSAFVYDFLEDDLKIANKTAVYILNCIDGTKTIEDIVTMCLLHFSECSEDFVSERVIQDTLDFIGKLENGEVIYYV